jgi:GntR family transcriptional regulator, transcriptional repressor for pyruvate dehydrogenase complex
VVANVSLPPVRKTNPIATTGGGTVRSPKTAELVARSLRRMVVDGDLKDGDYLPNEAELMTHFGVSRPTLREAVRLLESERLVEVRRGSRTGARVRMPGPEIVARPVGLLLEVAGATMADVMVARSGIEPLAARLLAEQGTPSAIDELELILTDEVPTAWRSGRLACRTFGQCHAQRYRRHVARDIRAAHRSHPQRKAHGSPSALRQTGEIVWSFD